MAITNLNERICNRCRSSVFLSENPDYVYECRMCDEDLDTIETSIRPTPTVEGTKEDTGFKSLNHVDEECPYCSEVTYNIPTDRVSLCAHCNAELVPCAGCDANAFDVHGCEIGNYSCSYSSSADRCDRFNKPTLETLLLVFTGLCGDLPLNEDARFRHKRKEIAVYKDEEYPSLFDVHLFENDVPVSEFDDGGFHDGVCEGVYFGDLHDLFFRFLSDSKETDTEKCDICKDPQSTTWCCEECGSDFCADCFIRSCSAEAYHDTLTMDAPNDFVLCPCCYKTRVGSSGNEVVS